jgi:hypothetical protein
MRTLRGVCAVATAALVTAASVLTQRLEIGQERALLQHLRSGEELKLSVTELVAFGRSVFLANWTDQDGAGRPLMKGTGARLSDPSQPLVGLRSMNRVSGPDANSCAGCHNAPFGIPGGSGDIASVVFQMAQRFDFATFDRTDAIKTRGSNDEAGRPATLQSIGNGRTAPALFGAGYLEMLARQLTQELQQTRDAIQPGESRALIASGISFGMLARRQTGQWDTSRGVGLPPQSLSVAEPGGKPSLIVRPWQVSGTAVSLREVSNTALNQHFGMQSTERFGVGTDPDGDAVTNEITRGDVTALTMYQATLPVPGRVIPRDPQVQRMVEIGERTFAQVGCASCHIPSLPLARAGWRYSEPGPYNSSGDYRRPVSRIREVDLTDRALPQPRLEPTPDEPDVIFIAAYTDFKLHDITDPSDDQAQEPLDINQPPGSPKFLAGNRRFLTRRLWGLANHPPYFHDGRFTTIREAVVAHSGEALEQRRAFERLPLSKQDAVLEFLQTLQVLPPGTTTLIVDEQYRPR